MCQLTSHDLPESGLIRRGAVSVLFGTVAPTASMAENGDVLPGMGPSKISMRSKTTISCGECGGPFNP